MRILITGAGGFVGSNVVERLCARGHDVVGLVRPAKDASAQSAARLAAFPRRPNFRWMEISRDLPVRDSTPFDVCIHLAGRSSVRESLQNPGLYEDENCRFSMWLLEWMRKNGCRRVIHASTVMIYGKDAPLPYCEDSIGSTPASFYGASKLAIEAQMNTWRSLHGMETINLRLFSVYGAAMRQDCVPHLIASAILAEREFNVFGDGSSVRDYVAIDDVVDAFEAAVNAPWSKTFPLALNVGSGVGTGLLELIRMLESGLLKKMRIVFKPAVEGELHAIVADVSAAKIALNWEPRVRIGDGMAQLAEWYR